MVPLDLLCVFFPRKARKNDTQIMESTALPKAKTPLA
jgi:hypothetical protein